VRLRTTCIRCFGSAAVIIALLAPAAAWAQGGGLPPVNASPNKVGSGARALGMGGAFIAVADDATAASWNPGGLTQLQRPEISVVYNWNWVREDWDDAYYDDVDGAQTVNFSDLNFASAVYPLPFTLGGRNMVVSLNYQRQFDFDSALDFTRRDVTPFTGAPAAPNLAFNVGRKTDINFRQEGSLSTLSPAFAMEITPRISVGVAVNIWDQSLIPDNEWKTRNEFRRRTRVNAGSPSFSFGRQDEEYTDFDGTNYTFGIRWTPTERLSLGAVYNTKFHADVRYEREFIANTFGGQIVRPRTFREKRRIEWPSSWGVGVAYRFPNDKLTISLDVTKTNWDEFVEIGRSGPVTLIGPIMSNAPFDTLFPGFARERISPITGLPKPVSDIDPTYTVRLGMEYVFFDEDKPLKKLLPSLRAGVFSDPIPSGGRPNSRLLLDRPERGDGEPEEQYGFTLGAGVLINNRINIDAAYEFRWAPDARTDTLGRYNIDADVTQHRLFLSTVIFF